MTHDEDLEASFENLSVRLQGVLDGFVDKLGGALRETSAKYTLKARLKTLESYLEKRSRRASSRPAREYVHDLLGVRVVVPFLEDVDVVVAQIQRCFAVYDLERKAEDLSFREFAYDSVHLVITDPNVTLAYPPGCVQGSCEIQVRTTLQDAWAEVEHELVYKTKASFPDRSMRKKLAALNANLALSDIIFQEIRDRQNELRRWGSERFHELERQASALDASDLATALADGRQIGVDRNQEALTDTLTRALRAHRESDCSTAVRRYSQALELRPTMDVRALIYDHRGLAYFTLQNERAALRDFERSVKCDPTYYPAWTKAALVWRRFGHLEKALEDLARSLQIESHQPHVRYIRAQTLFEAGELSAALEEVDRALAFDPNHADAAALRERIDNAIALRAPR